MLKPLGTRVAIQPEQSPKQSPGGIHLPFGQETSLSCWGKVISIGDDVKTLNKGDRVAYSRYCNLVEVDETTKLALIKEEDILAVDRAN